MGTGTTAVSAKKLSRNYIGFEKQEEYIEVANKRILNYDKNF
jgi:site-specific DNA-methyltransferase (adenine-specific)